MPVFRLDQQNELAVWDLGYAAAEAAGYLRWPKRKTEAHPLAATSFVAGFMGGAFLGQLPSWIEDALEPEVVRWIREGYIASQSLNGEHIGKPYEANTADETPHDEREEKVDVQGIPISFSISIGASSEGVVEMITGPLIEETWRPVIHYPGGFVSNLGRVRDWKGLRKARMSQSHVYPNVEIPYGGSKLVHRVVAETWLGPRPKGLFICHSNDNKLDARVVNLRYGTPAENMRDRIRNREYKER
jgi:hypothetical protein